TEEKKASEDKEKAVEVKVSEVKMDMKKSRMKLTMKQKMTKNKAARVQRRVIVQDEDSEETEEEQPEILFSAGQMSYTMSETTV
ncbi:hypothetical protein A2U01_0086288, partial [Trifolium medium]|nr:hypothetical protein [Trifolium medium]